MSQRRKRILWVGEASYLSTGYAVYGHEVLSRLHATGKYDICELGCYAQPGDPRQASVPWSFIPNCPAQGDEEGNKQYHALPTNQFGEWKFEEACLAFRPDICTAIRDWWCDEYLERSPYRRFYHLAMMPAVDAAPQDEQWIATFMNADAVFTYSDWGLEVLREQSRGRIRLKGSAPPGADLNTLRPVADRAAHRAILGIQDDALIVGTVMRNQKRKLYPDLVQAFAQFLREAPAAVAKRTFLYMHTSWPDVGWDIPRLVMEAGVGSKCVFTYACRECGATYPSYYQDARASCRRCGKPSAGFPNTHAGLTRKALADVINLFDVYVQYANSEGFGMPQVEAAACGVPVMAVDYSAMSDVVRKLGGYPIKVARLAREAETHCWRALPDNSDFVRQLIEFLSLPESARARKRYEARKAVETHYTYEKTAKVWENHIDSVTVRPWEQTWLSPIRAHEPDLRQPSPNLSDADFVRWGMERVAGRPDLADSYTALRMTRDLTWGATLPSTGGLYFNDASTLGEMPRHQPFDRERCVRELLKIAERDNRWEARRAVSKGGAH